MLIYDLSFLGKMLSIYSAVLSYENMETSVLTMNHMF